MGLSREYSSAIFDPTKTTYTAFGLLFLNVFLSAVLIINNFRRTWVFPEISKLHQPLNSKLKFILNFVYCYTPSLFSNFDVLGKFPLSLEPSCRSGLPCCNSKAWRMATMIRSTSQVASSPLIHLAFCKLPL